ncbi:hypothetical protein D3C72_2217610 [compost metagenome]
MDSSRRRLVSAQATLTSASASARLDTTMAFSTTSTAPEASTLASSCGNAFGSTRYSRVRPMVFIARAAEPILPGWLGRASTTRMFFKKSGTWGLFIGYFCVESRFIQKLRTTRGFFVP